MFSAERNRRHWEEWRICQYTASLTADKEDNGIEESHLGIVKMWESDIVKTGNQI